MWHDFSPLKVKIVKIQSPWCFKQVWQTFFVEHIRYFEKLLKSIRPRDIFKLLCSQAVQVWSKWWQMFHFWANRNTVLSIFLFFRGEKTGCSENVPVLFTRMPNLTEKSLKNNLLYHYYLELIIIITIIIIIIKYKYYMKYSNYHYCYTNFPSEVFFK